MSAPQYPEFLGTSSHYQTYTNASSPVNLITAGNGVPCRLIRCEGAGTLVVKRASDSTQVTLNFKAGETQLASAVSIDSGTATGITVFW